jgi:hypothetical protein
MSERIGIKDLHPRAQRHAFAIRLVERGGHEYMISSLWGHCRAVSGFRHSHIVYGHTWEPMVRAIESLEHRPVLGSVFDGSQTKFGQSNSDAAKRERRMQAKR